MRPYVLIFLMPVLAGCDVVAPTLLTGPTVEGVSPEAFVNASVSVLHENGYTVITADRRSGVVTTDWRAESSFVGQALLDLSRRTRVSVVVDFYTHELKVQMTKQKKEGGLPWRNDGLSNDDRERMQVMLDQIRTRAGAIQAQNVQSVVGG